MNKENSIYQNSFNSTMYLLFKGVQQQSIPMLSTPFGEIFGQEIITIIKDFELLPDAEREKARLIFKRELIEGTYAETEEALNFFMQTLKEYMLDLCTEHGEVYPDIFVEAVGKCFNEPDKVSSNKRTPTTDKYWDCECEKDYIHDKRHLFKCNKCGAIEPDMPDSIVSEVWGKHIETVRLAFYTIYGLLMPNYGEVEIKKIPKDKLNSEADIRTAVRYKNDKWSKWERITIHFDGSFTRGIIKD